MISDWISDWTSDLMSDLISDWISDLISELISDSISDWISDLISNFISDSISGDCMRWTRSEQDFDKVSLMTSLSPVKTVHFRSYWGPHAGNTCRPGLVEGIPNDVTVTGEKIAFS